MNNNIQSDNNKKIKLEIQDKILDVSFPKSKIEKFVNDAMEIFTRWVENGQIIYISNDFDPSFDCSGMSFTRKMKNKDLEKILDGTLYEWSENNYTGNTIESFCSGMGFFHETYIKQIEEDIKDEVYNFFKSRVYEETWEFIFENDLEDVSNYIELQTLNIFEEFIDTINKIPARKAYLQFAKKS